MNDVIKELQEELKAPAKKCVGCGLCCCKTTCAAGLRLYGSKAKPCPALKWNGEKNICDLMTLPGDLGGYYRKELYAGAGCCMGLFNDWRKDIRDRTKPETPVDMRNPIPPLMQGFLRAIGKQPFLSGDAMVLVILGFIGDLKDAGMPEDEAEALKVRIVEGIVNHKTNICPDFMPEMELPYNKEK